MAGVEVSHLVEHAAEHGADAAAHGVEATFENSHSVVEKATAVQRGPP